MIQFLKKIRCALLVWCTHSVALPFIRIVKKMDPFPYSIPEMRQWHEYTLGAALLRFLQTHDLHLLKDYETHDIKHTLLGYPATEEGEASLQYFFLGNGHRSFPVIITVLVTFIVMPEYQQKFKKAYHRGRLTPPLKAVNWAALLPLPVDLVQQQLNIQPI